MIELYSGTPGSGKSLHVAKIIRERLRMYNCVIIGNFYVNQNTVKKRKGTYIYVDNSRLYPERLIKFAIRYARHKGRRLKEDELYLFIDEAQLLFNSRDWQLIKTSGWVSFYSQHRKLGFYIGLIAQFDRMLDRQIRSLVENEIKHRKVSRAGLFGKLLGFLTGDNLFIYIKIWYPMKQTTDLCAPERLPADHRRGNRGGSRAGVSVAHPADPRCAAPAGAGVRDRRPPSVAEGCA